MKSPMIEAQSVGGPLISINALYVSDFTMSGTDQTYIMMIGSNDAIRVQMSYEAFKKAHMEATSDG